MNGSETRKRKEKTEHSNEKQLSGAQERAANTRRQ